MTLRETKIAQNIHTFRTKLTPISGDFNMVNSFKNIEQTHEVNQNLENLTKIQR